MPRTNKIWFWKARNEWCVKIKRVRHRLGPDKAEAERRFHQLKAAPDEEPVPVDLDAAATVIDEFLDWTQKNREDRSYRWYRDHLQSFLDSITPKSIAVSEIKPEHVERWLDSHAWRDSVRRGAITAVLRAFNWAEKRGRIDRNPLRGRIEKPPAGKREQVISPAEYKQILKIVTGPFRDLLVTVWETGCRPQEVTRVEARHVEFSESRWVFPVKESKGKKKKRVVWLTPGVLAIVKRLVGKNPEGPLYRNSDGDPWTPSALNCAFLRLQVELGKRSGKPLAVSKAAIAAKARVIQKSRERRNKPPIPESKLQFFAKKSLVDIAARKLAPKYCLYAFRHSYITNGLKKGVDPLTMANLVGHVDLKMIHSVYSHVSQDPAFMRKAALLAAH